METISHIEHMLEHIDTALSAAGEGVIVFEADGQVAYASTLAEQLLGLQPQQHGPRRVTVALTNMRQKSALPALHELRSEQLPLVARITGAGPDRLIRISGAGQDRTYLLQDMTEQLEQGGGEGDHEFLDIVAHDLRAGLVPIKTYTQMLMTGMLGNLTEKQTETLRSIDLCVQRQVEKITAISDLTKIARNKLEIRRESVNIAEPLTRAIDGIRKDCTRRGVSINLQIDERMSLIEGDEERLRRVFGNLLARAVRQTIQGQSLGVDLAYLPDGRARVRIWDTGAGKPNSDLELLKPSGRDEAMARILKERSLGPIDLATMPEIIRLHRGTFTYQTEENTGTTFVFYFPALTKLPALPAPAARRVLIAGADDSETAALRKVLEPYQAEIVTLQDGPDAVRAARERHFDLVFFGARLSDADRQRTLPAIAFQRPGDPQAYCVLQTIDATSSPNDSSNLWRLNSRTIDKDGGTIVSAMMQSLKTNAEP